MAVVQISRIQVRRGQKNSSSGVPQLSSGEFAWAVDSQELFIGNGSIVEGAPYVGNTKILTEHDNILDLSSSYKFGGHGVLSSINRPLQHKLDETVSVLDFGAIPDGETDCSDSFAQAFNALYSGSAPLNKTLFLPAGIYYFGSDLKIPSNVSIRGESQHNVILNINDHNIVFTSTSGEISPNFNDSVFPTNISISDVTIDHRSGQTDISASRFCIFNNVHWRSNYILGTPTIVTENANNMYILPIVGDGGNISVSGTGILTPFTQVFSGSHNGTVSSVVGLLNADATFSSLFVASSVDSALKITTLVSSALSSEITTSIFVSVQQDNLSFAEIVDPISTEYNNGSNEVNASVKWINSTFGTRTSNIRFVECRFSDTPLAINCQQLMVFDTIVDFINTEFFNCDTGIFINGVAAVNNIHQGNFWCVTGCRFDAIASHAFIATYGGGTKIVDCGFKNCGNGVNSAQYPSSPIVKFGESLNNIIVNCSSNRHQMSSISLLPTTTTNSITEFENASYATLIDRNYAPIFTSDSERALSVFPLSNRFMFIDYFLSLGHNTLGNFSRVGRLTITVGDDLAGFDNISNITISDQYSYSPASIDDTGGMLMTNFEFSTAIGDFDEDSNVETLILNYKNPVSSGANGTITYSVTYGNV